MGIFMRRWNSLEIGEKWLLPNIVNTLSIMQMYFFKMFTCILCEFYLNKDKYFKGD